MKKPHKRPPIPPARNASEAAFDALFVPCAPDPDPVCDLCERRASEGCRCWVRLRCAGCDDTTTVERVIAEDGDDDEVVTLCPDCVPKPSPESEPPPAPRSA